MPSIKLNELSVDKAKNTALSEGYVFKDLLFPIENRVSYSDQLEKHHEIHDVQGLYDLQCIQNSIANCLITSPGEKILNPTFGINLRQFLFSPIDDFQSTKIRDIITSRLPKMEPRIQLQNVQIIPYVDQQQYEIVIDYDVESLDMYGATQRAILNNNGYTITTE
tara:strand:- start:10859 stop:11353 length:495 start_codon:yes stop_codon:yes gene_type:complete